MITVAKHTKIRGAHLDRGTCDPLIKHVDVDFGTYHHSTPEESNNIRERILDAGCGLGFLTYVAARCSRKLALPGLSYSGMAASLIYRWIRQ